MAPWHIRESFWLPNLEYLEEKVVFLKKNHDAMIERLVPFYHQRPWWYYIFAGLNGLVTLLLLWAMPHGCDGKKWLDGYADIYRYLLQNVGTARTIVLKPHKPNSIPTSGSLMLLVAKGTLQFRCFADTVLRRAPRALEAIEIRPRTPLTVTGSQSKLSQEQLSELQRSTHFDKKELQQWYKGMT